MLSAVVCSLLLAAAADNTQNLWTGKVQTPGASVLADFAAKFGGRNTELPSKLEQPKHADLPVQVEQPVAQQQAQFKSVGSSGTDLKLQVLATAEACQTLEELQAWRENAMAQVRFVPKAYQEFPMKNVEDGYLKRLKELSIVDNTTAGDAGVTSNGVASPTAQTLSFLAGSQPRSTSNNPVDQMKDLGGYRQHIPGQMRQVTGTSLSSQSVEPSQQLSQNSASEEFRQCWNIQLRAELPGREVIKLPVPLMTASMCQDERDLEVWRSCQLTEIRDHIPKNYHRFAVEKVAQQFEDRQSELHPLKDGSHPREERPAAPELPVLLVVADKCASEAELVAWHAHQLTLIHNYVSPGYRIMAEGSVERTFTQHLARLKALQHRRPSGPGTTPGGASELQKQGGSAIATELVVAAPTAAASFHFPVALLLIVLGGLALPALISFLSSTMPVRRRSRESHIQGYSIQGYSLEKMGRKASGEDGEDGNAYSLQA